LIKKLIACYIVGNVSYKNSAAIGSFDFPQENQKQQVHTDSRFDTKIALFLYIVVARLS